MDLRPGQTLVVTEAVVLVWIVIGGVDATEARPGAASISRAFQQAGTPRGASTRLFLVQLFAKTVGARRATDDRRSRGLAVGALEVRAQKCFCLERSSSSSSPACPGKPLLAPDIFGASRTLAGTVASWQRSSSSMVPRVQPSDWSANQPHICSFIRVFSAGERRRRRPHQPKR